METVVQEIIMINQPKKFYVPKRYIVIILGFFGMFNVYAMRTNLSVAMVAMVNQTAVSATHNSVTSVIECPKLIPENQHTEKSEFKGEQFNWDSKTQGRILGCFFYGYVLTQLPGGILSEKFGAKWLFGCGIMVTAVLSLVTPLAARIGTATLIAVRVIEGFGEGVTFPAMNLAISTWSPQIERSRFSTVVYTGSHVGNVISMPISGFLSSSNYLGGWPSVFYVFGAIGCLWFVLWCFLIHETPAKHPTISKEELLFIEQHKDIKPKQKSNIPWRSIFTSAPMWALIIAHSGHNFGYIFLMTEMPTYLNSILHFDLESNGLLSALPYVCQAVTAWFVSCMADWLRKSSKMSITNIRKLFNSLGLFGPGICLIMITFSGCQRELIVALLTLALAFNGCVYSGFNVTHIDMCPEYAGTTFAITNAISNLCGIFGPVIVGVFTATGATLTNWNYVFYIAAAIYIFSGLVFLVTGSAELQPWGTVEEETLNETNLPKEHSPAD